MANKTSGYDLTVIVPVYNEADNMPRLEATLAAWLPQAKYDTCVLFVDDGSTDDSLRLIRDTCRRQPHFFYAALERNNGLSTALKAGFDLTESRFVGYIDADLQTSPEDFNLLLDHIASYELVTGIRTGRKDSMGKRLQSRLANGFRRMMTHDGAQDTGCPLKVMHTGCARRLPMFRGMHRFLPALVMMTGGRVWQVPVRHFPRTAGKSKYHLANRLVAPFIDCFAYRWMRSRYVSYQVRDEGI